MDQKSMPPMPPPGGIPAPAPAFFFGTSATMASVVISSAATEAAFWIATRTTLVGSNDALGDQVAVLADLRVEAVGVLLLLEDLADDDRAVFTGFDRDLAGRRGQRLAHNLDAGLLVVVPGANPLEMLGGTQQSDAAARHDAFFNRRAGRMHRVINAILALLDFDFGRAADADHRDAAREPLLRGLRGRPSPDRFAKVRNSVDAPDS